MEEDFIGKCSVGMINMLLMTLNKRVSLAFFHCVSKVDQLILSMIFKYLSALMSNTTLVTSCSICKNSLGTNLLSE